MRLFSRLFLLSIPLVLYLHLHFLSKVTKTNKIEFSKLPKQFKEILETMKPVLQPEKQNPYLAKKINQTFNGYSKEDEKKMLDVASGL